MQQIYVTNTLTGKKDPLPVQPESPKHIRLYACGVTVYDDCHIGHAMQAIYFDVIRSYLEYCGYQVTYVRNYTDVDDKIIDRAKDRGMSPLELSNKMIESSRKDMAAIGVRPATHEPKVSENIPEIIAMVQAIIDRGFGYATAKGDVYFRVRKKSDYGKLSNRKPDELRSGTRDIVLGEKEDDLDFALWKADTTANASWQSPWGLGRPGWHIECSAMARRYLGESFELHGGGRDLVFPHHENEIAQSEAAHNKEYAKCWLHSGLLTINHQKMSKSLGNHISIQKFLEKWPPEVLRLGFLMNHYQSNIDFSQGTFQTCLKRLLYYYESLAQMESYSAGEPPSKKSLDAVTALFHQAMSDDFNTAKAIGELNKSFKNAMELMSSKKSKEKCADVGGIYKALIETGKVLGLFLNPASETIHNLKRKILPDLGITEDEIQSAIEKRKNARACKDFTAADTVRNELLKRGIELRDSPEGTTWSLRFSTEE
jgi:cysteinyl-tRNA synthetase